jgi:hypothetical protein
MTICRQNQLEFLCLSGTIPLPWPICRNGMSSVRGAGAANASACLTDGRYSAVMENFDLSYPWSRSCGALAAEIERRAVLCWRVRKGTGHDLRTKAWHLRLFVGLLLHHEGILYPMQSRRRSRFGKAAARTKLHQQALALPVLPRVGASSLEPGSFAARLARPKENVFGTGATKRSTRGSIGNNNAKKPPSAN